MSRVVCTIALLAFCSVGAADSMRCGNDLVLKDDHVVDVRNKCGDPVRVTRLENEFGAVVGKREVYDNAYGSRDHLVTYRQDRVVRIERLR